MQSTSIPTKQALSCLARATPSPSRWRAPISVPSVRSISVAAASRILCPRPLSQHRCRVHFDLRNLYLDRRLRICDVSSLRFVLTCSLGFALVVPASMTFDLKLASPFLCRRCNLKFSCATSDAESTCINAFTDGFCCDVVICSFFK
jgi:hypothetical protein